MYRNPLVKPWHKFMALGYAGGATGLDHKLDTNHVVVYVQGTRICWE